MVRIESLDQRDFERELLPNIRRRRPRRSLKRKLKKYCCCLFLILLFFGLIVGLAALAKSGVVQIPGFSSWFYQLPKPEHFVKLAESDLVSLQSSLNSTSAAGSLKLELTEQELTYLLQQLLTTGEQPYFAKNLQAVINGDKQIIEIFGLLLRPVKTNLTIDVSPQVVSGQLQFNVLQAKLGELSLPLGVVNSIVGSLVDTTQKDLATIVASFGEIKSIALSAGKIIISGQPKK